MRSFLFLSFTFFFLQSIQSQNVVQSIAGTVLDQQSEMPLIGANIRILEMDGATGASTDFDGYFRIEGISPGRYTVEVSYLGYESRTLSNINVTSGKSVILDIFLEESIELLDEIVITATQDKSKTVNEMATVSARTFSVEEVTRYSGGRSDVGRLAANFAGVSTSNDARNDIVIKGNSPTGVLWRLEGIPIPNPNHYSTLGTTGGPVSALNPNLLKNSDFLTSAFPAEYGNALAGVFDLGFRNGNKEEREHMFQVGAISGVEFMTEGPISRENNSSYMVSGRYSFVGLASEIGLNVGTNATPRYQDIAFKVNLGKSKLGQFTIFGMGGTSDIEFLHDQTGDDDLFALEDEDSRAESAVGVIGVKHNIILDEKTYLRTIVGVSTARNDFKQDRLFNIDEPDEFKIPYVLNNNTENRLTLHSFVNKKYSARFTSRIGVLFERSNFDVRLQTREERPDLDGDGFRDLQDAYVFNSSADMFQGYYQSQYKASPKWTFNLGVRGQYFFLNESFAVEPRVAVNYHLSEKQTLNLGYGLHNQSQPLPILLLQDPSAIGENAMTNKDLSFTSSHHLVLGYDWNFSSDWRLKLESYYQFIQNVPVEPEPTSFSLLNAGADFVFPTDVYGLVNEGTGFNRGIELTVEKFFSNGFYGLFTGSVYESKYKGSDNVERNTAFNNTYVVNFLAGKEFPLGKEKRKTFTIDTKVTTAGGRRFTPVDLEASAVNGFEVRDDINAFSERFDPYFRWDLKIGFRSNSKKRNVSHHFFFDFQNLTNKKNIFIQRYNRLDNTVDNVNQIGFFPDFMYRIEF